jgi:very-short-patch-repair endonuclease
MLYSRLLACLPNASPPQRNLCTIYHQIYGSRVYDMPALLPEVCLLWDWKTRSQRTLDEMLTMRMDFLLLLPNGQRIVLEVDGAHHYSDYDRKANAGKYADTVGGDRELKLAGYEVFRFGAVELMPEARALAVLQPFFAALFQRYLVPVPTEPRPAAHHPEDTADPATLEDSDGVVDDPGPAAG